MPFRVTCSSKYFILPVHLTCLSLVHPVYLTCPCHWLILTVHLLPAHYTCVSPVTLTIYFTCSWWLTCSSYLFVLSNGSSYLFVLSNYSLYLFISHVRVTCSYSPFMQLMFSTRFHSPWFQWIQYYISLLWVLKCDFVIFILLLWWWLLNLCKPV